MGELELVLLLSAAIVLMATLARRIGVPYPILMVIGGLLLGLIPGLPRVQLAPELILLVFLPPILFGAAAFTSFRDLRQNLRPLSLLAFGLVLATTLVVALVVHWIVPQLGWPAAFTLGAIVSPTDAVAATSIARRLGLPQRLIVVMEGESLLNDATGLTAYRLAVAAVVGGVFSLSAAAAELAFVAVVGVLAGLLVGWLMVLITSRINDPPVEVTVTLIAPFAAYLLAENLGASGVLSTVAAGLVAGRSRARAFSSQSRVLGTSVWEMVTFLINGFVFVLIGLQLPVIMSAAQLSPSQFLLVAGAVSLAVVLVRLAWVFPSAYLPRYLFPGIRRRDPYPSWRVVAILGWAGMRGGLSLAAALALPTITDAGAPFPGRDLMIFCAFGVIVVTLVGQGLTLPLLIRSLGVTVDSTAAEEEAYARGVATEAALERLDGLAELWPGHLELIDNYRARYADRASHADAARDQELLEHQEIRHEVIEAERLAVLDLRDRGLINDDVLRRIERDLDLEELRMEA